MPAVILTIGQNGKLCGVSREDRFQFTQFCKRAHAMSPGETLTFSYEVARSQKMHARYFVAIAEIWENQEVFKTADDLREWAERGAGYLESFEIDGLPWSRVKSIAYDKLDGDAFSLLFTQVKAFILSPGALHKLWPHAHVSVSYEGANLILESSK